MNITELIQSENQLRSQAVNLNEVVSRGDPQELREEFSRILDKIARELRSRGVGSEQVLELGQATEAVRRVLQHYVERTPASRPELKVRANEPSHEAVPTSESNMVHETAADEEQGDTATEEVAEQADQEQLVADRESTSEEGASDAATSIAAAAMPAVRATHDEMVVEGGHEPPVATEEESTEAAFAHQNEVTEEVSTDPTHSQSVKGTTPKVIQDSASNEVKVIETTTVATAAAPQPQAANVADEAPELVGDDAAMFLTALRERSAAAQEMFRPVLGAMQRLSVDSQAALVSSMLQLNLAKQALDSAIGQEVRAVTGVTAGTTATPQVQGAVGNPRALVNDGPRAQRQATRGQMLKAFEKVENALKEVAQSKDGKTIQVRLEPDQLGKVRVSVSMREGVLHARVVPDSNTMIDALRDRSHELHSMLRRLGMDIDRIEVSIGSEYVGDGTAQYQGQGSSRSTRGDESFYDGMESESSQVEQVQSAVAKGPESVSADDGHWVA